ncbi:nuclear transport factor 2 family protein [Thalassoglobus sp. JC818]|uniref:nuclear transport factor 2 family protein n=1 Tax=Thalassoglobus sp. JC818 TaxID=3232136 RepID=UPI00345A424C
MTIHLPTPVAAYFHADKIGSDAVANCFADNAVVSDEGHTYEGRDSIKKWKDAASSKYQYECEPLTTEQQGDTTIVSCRLTGNFPGGTAVLRFAFEFDGDRISSLKIRP